MNLLIISTEFPPGPGGIGTHAYQVAKNMMQIGWDVTIVSRQDYAETTEICKFNNKHKFHILSLPQIENSLKDALFRWYTLIKQIMAYQPDLILATGSRSSWISAFLPFSVPLVVVGHGTEFGLSGLSGLLTRYAFEKASCVICVSEFTRQFMLTKRIQPKRTTVINNGADASIFKVLPKDVTIAYKSELGFKESQKLLLTVGNVTERKGQDVVIRALAKVICKFPDVHYLIVGLPTERERFSRLASELGVHSNVHFLGRVSQDDLVKLYNICDLFLMTSRETSVGDFEGYGIAVVEAALCGKTSVVTGNSGLEEAVINGRTGIVVDQEDYISTARATVNLLEDDTLRYTLGRNAREHALNNQTWSKVALKYDQLFRSIIAS